MIRRFAVALSLLLLFPLFAAAQQNNELGGFISTSQFSEDEIQNAGDIFDVEFDEDMGYGVLYNRYWTRAFSTEFAYQKLGADLTVSLQDITEQAGDLDLDVLSATGQFHFIRGGVVSPYIGAGAAYISGQAGSIDPDELQDVDLADEFEWLANAGIDFNIGQSLSIFLDGKYILYEARGEDDPDEEAIELNPLVLSAGVKWRF